MVKIVKPGKTNTQMWPYTAKFSCYHCDCEFRLEQGDKFKIRSVNTGDQREDGDWAHTDCPNCGRDVTGYPRGSL